MLKNLGNKIVVGVALTGPALAFAQGTGTDYSSIAAAVSMAGVAAAIVGMGALKIVPNVASWASNKLANFFR